MCNSMKKYEEERDRNYDLYYAVFYGDVDEVERLLNNGANPNYVIPGKGESTRDLAKRLQEQGKLCFKIKKMLGI